MMPNLKISSEQDGRRLDVILARTYPDHSRSFLQKWIKEGRVTRQGESLVPNYRVRAGETIEVASFETAPRNLRTMAPSKEITDLLEGFKSPSILFEDKVLLVINKPAGLVVHPAPSHKGLTLVDWLEDYLGPKVTALFADASRIGVVHRLDKDTTGVLLVAKTVSAQNLISKQFQDRKIKKTYAAFIEGILKSPTGLISAPVGRSQNVPTRMAVSSTGRPSETSFEVVKAFKEVSQVSLHPKTGRTHQIRVHCAAIGHPIVGDHTYGSGPQWAAEYGIHRPLLHAEELELEHPTTHRTVVFKAPWPADMKKALALFRSSMKVVLCVVSLSLLSASAHAADGEAPSAPAHKAKTHSSTGSSSALQKEMTSLQSQFKSLIEEVSALQDRVTSIQSSLDEMDGSKRLHDLEKAIPDLNGKAVTTSNTAEETKSQVLDLSHKLKTQQDTLDQLRDQVDRLRQELITAKTHAEENTVPTPVGK